jgi:hypothetical protein
MTMQARRPTRIDDLAALGQELPAQHLALAAGGRMPRTTYRTYIQCQSDTGSDD